jgi:hypothetical protein
VLPLAYYLVGNRRKNKEEEEEPKYASLRKHANLGGVIGGTLALPLAAMASTQGGGHAGRVFNLGRRTGNAAQNIFTRRKGSARPLPSKPGLRRYTDAEIAAMPEFSAYADRLTDPEDLLLDMPSELATRYQELTEGVPEEQKYAALKTAGEGAEDTGSPFVHYSKDEIDQPRSRNYDELMVDRARGSWAGKPELTKAYVDERRKTEDGYREKLKGIGVEHDPNQSFLYATMKGREQFGDVMDGFRKNDVNLSPDDIKRTLFDLVGLPEDQLNPDGPQFGQAGLDAATKLWDANKNNLANEDYMGMSIRPRIEVITPGTQSEEPKYASLQTYALGERPPEANGGIKPPTVANGAVTSYGNDALNSMTGYMRTKGNPTAKSRTTLSDAASSGNQSKSAELLSQLQARQYTPEQAAEFLKASCTEEELQQFTEQHNEGQA